MSPSPEFDKRAKAWLSFLAGFGFMVKFMFWTPASLNPAVAALIAACLFGPGIIALWKGGKDDEQT